MVRLRSAGLRRPLTIYLVTVVGPTLVLLTLAVMTVRRQAEAMRAQSVAAIQQQEQRIRDEIERHIELTCAKALRDVQFLKLTAELRSRNIGQVQRARRALNDLRTHHPVISDVFVAGPSGAHYPPIQPPLPLTHEEALREEPEATRARVIQLLSDGDALEEVRHFEDAIRTYRAAESSARTREGQALARFGVARTMTSGGIPGADAEWRDVATRFSDAYTLEGRPLALVAASYLRPESAANIQILDHLKQSFRYGRWVITPSQAEHFQTRLWPASIPDATSPVNRTLELANDLDTVFPSTRIPVGGRVEFGSVQRENRRHLLGFTRLDADAVAGIVMNEQWLADQAGRIADRLDPVGRVVRVRVSPPGGLPYRSGVARWQVDLRPLPTTAWRRVDIAVFGAGVLAVVGTLVLGVVMLARDVGREVELNRLRADMVSGVSHELKTPLSVIRMYAETIRDVVGDESGRGAQFAQTIVQETDRLHRLIDDVVDFSRIQQGRRIYSPAPQDLRPILLAICDRFSEYAGLHGLTLTTHIPASIPTVRIDSRAFEQAVLNLLDNAAKYAGESTEITLAVQVATHEVAIAVHDHGPGIAAEVQRWIFQQFRRGEHRDRGGYGLGLYLVKHVMDAHGGRVSVWSEPGVGSRFTLYFPTDQQAHA